MNKIEFSELDRIVEIERASAQLPDQELMSFVREIWEGAVRSAEAFDARPGQVSIRAIFRDQVIVFDEGNDRHIRLDVKRNKKDGALTFKNPTVVRQQWIEQGAIQRSDVEAEAPEKSDVKVIAVERNTESLFRDVVGFAV